MTEPKDRAFVARTHIEHAYLKLQGKNWVYIKLSQWGSIYTPYLYIRKNGQWTSTKEHRHIHPHSTYRHQIPDGGECIVFKTGHIEYHEDMHNELAEIELLTHLEALAMFHS